MGLLPQGRHQKHTTREFLAPVEKKKLCVGAEDSPSFQLLSLLLDKDSLPLAGTMCIYMVTPNL